MAVAQCHGLTGRRVQTDFAIHPRISMLLGPAKQRRQHRTPLIGETPRVIALHQISHQHVLADGMGHARLHPVGAGPR
jgi:hypothetical protein